VSRVERARADRGKHDAFGRASKASPARESDVRSLDEQESERVASSSAAASPERRALLLAGVESDRDVSVWLRTNVASDGG
jgi:hypothetical protein